MKKNILVGLLTLLPFSLSAAECSVDGAHVTELFQWSDGSIFIALDKASNCACPIPTRFGFHKNDNEKFFVSAALTAYTTGKLVSLKGEDTGCVIHGNTAKLTTFMLRQ